MTHLLRHRFSQLLRCEQGSFIILFALALLVLGLAAGFAIDVAREEALQSRMQAASDAGALATGQMVGTCFSGASASSQVTSAQIACMSANGFSAESSASGPRKESALCSAAASTYGCATSNTVTECMQAEMYMYYDANLPTGYMQSSGVCVTPTLNANGSVTLSSSTTQTLSFITPFLSSFGGAGTVGRVAASSTVSIGNSYGQGIEVVLALDNTGSMGSTLPGDGITKLKALENSVPVLLNELYGAGNDVLTYPGDSNQTPVIWVGMVPYTNMVNVGSYLSPSYLKGSPSSPPANSRGCVDARTLPSPVPSHNVYGDDTCTKGIGCSPLSSDISLDTGSTFTYLALQLNQDINTDLTPTPLLASACPASIIPIQSTKSAINTALNTLHLGTTTMINTGLAWAWRMMNGGGPWPVANPDPAVGALWSTSNLSAVSPAYNTLVTGKKITEQKVIVLMTDGDNTDPNDFNSVTGLYQPQDNAYMDLDGNLSNARFTITNGQITVTGINVNDLNTAEKYTSPSAAFYETENLCDAIKAQGILIYTIGFGTADGVTVTNPSCNDDTCATFVNGTLLSYCASPGNYYLATNADELTKVFQTISYGLVSHTVLTK